MAAYVISEVEALDSALFGQYRILAHASIVHYGGRYIVRGGAIDVVEGHRDQDRQLLIIEFPSMARAREWYGSPEYAEALKTRAKALTRTLLFVDGVLPET
jgi:uncharacterized protein (DUF1330 family)